MATSRFGKINSVLSLAAAAVISTCLKYSLFSRRSELHSEILSWIILTFLFGSQQRKSSGVKPPFSNLEKQSTSSKSIWIIAAGLAASCIYRTELGMVWTLPALTPLLLVTQRYLQPEYSLSAPPNSGLLAILANTPWGTCLVAGFAILALWEGEVQKAALSGIAGSALLVVYIALLPKSRKSSRLLPVVSNIELVVASISRRLVPFLLVALCVQTFLFGFVWSNVVLTVLSSFAKALSWYFIIRLTHHTSWLIVTVVETFGLVSTRNPFTQPTEYQALLLVIASCIVLGQFIQMLPKEAKDRWNLWLLCLIPLIPYCWSIFDIISANTSAQSSFSHSTNHPIEILANDATAYHKSLLDEQSKIYSAACTEYERRYGIEPPPGFEAWYNFATSHHSPIIDNFDTMYQAISPFWRLSGDEVLDVMHGVHSASDSEVWLCDLATNSAKVYCTHSWRTYDRHVSFLFDRLLEDISIQIPGVKFLVNHLDEPRVIIPPQLPESSDSIRNRVFNLTNLSHQPVWDTITKYCTNKQTDRHNSINHKVDTFGLPFVTNFTSAIDICQHAEFSKMHGMVMSPTSLRLIEGLVPILSTGAPSTMGDILFPSPAYIEDEFLYSDTHDPDWAQKRNNLYWAGSTSGSFAIDDKWQHHHRQRFVKLAQNLERQQHHYLHEEDDRVSLFKSSFLNSRLYNVFFTRVFQCTLAQCHAQRAYFNTKSWADKDAALGSRLAFDIDGNGISGRYYKLLASKSCVLKQTIFREWHDDRLVPWVHFIPVSLGMEELPELVTYLTTNARGQRLAREVAEAGREWYGKALREVDMSVYVYRLLLELARLQDPKRKAIPPRPRA